MIDVVIGIRGTPGLASDWKTPHHTNDHGIFLTISTWLTSISHKIEVRIHVGHAWETQCHAIPHCMCIRYTALDWIRNWEASRWDDLVCTNMLALTTGRHNLSFSLLMPTWPGFSLRFGGFFMDGFPAREEMGFAFSNWQDCQEVMILFSGLFSSHRTGVSGYWARKNGFRHSCCFVAGFCAVFLFDIPLNRCMYIRSMSVLACFVRIWSQMCDLASKSAISQCHGYVCPIRTLLQPALCFDLSYTNLVMLDYQSLNGDYIPQHIVCCLKRHSSSSNVLFQH